MYFSSSNAHAEHRSSRRVVFHRRALLHAGHLNVHAKAVDISVKGCGLVVQQPLIDGQSCTLTIFCNCDGKPVELTATGKLVYCILSGALGYRVGIRFDAISQANKELIGKVIARSY
jgi:hypothetical protein